MHLLTASSLTELSLAGFFADRFLADSV